MEHYISIERLGVCTLIGCYQVWAYWKQKSTLAKLLPLWIILTGSVVIQAAAASLLWFVLWYPITEAVLWCLTAVTLIEAIIALYRKQHGKWVGLFSVLLALMLLINGLTKFF